MAGRCVLLRGSPRRGGNSDALADVFLRAARARKADVTDVALSDLLYQGCVNLFHCKSGLDHCGQVDDLTPVLAQIARAEVLALSTPVYFTSISGQLKLALDRFFSFFVPDYVTNPEKSRLGRGRHLVFLQTQGEPEARYEDLMQSFEASFAALGFDHRHLVRAWGVRERGDLEGRPDLEARCAEVAATVFA